MHNCGKAIVQKIACVDRRTDQLYFFYEEEILKQSKPVTIRQKDATVEEILDLAIAFQPKLFSYSINGKIILIKRTPKKWRTE